MANANLRAVRVLGGDNLPQIVNRELGDGTRLLEVVQLNNLRWPYVSDRPLDKYGPAEVTYTLTSPLSLGATTISLSGVASYLIRPSMIALFIEQLPSGVVNSETVVVSKYDGATLTFATATVNSYRAGAYLYICMALAGRGVVLGTGDTILIPISQSSTSQVAGADVARLYGTDLLMNRGQSFESAGTYVYGDGGGYLQLDPVSGDLATVSGFDNLAQALGHRIQTSLGWNAYNPAFGSTVHELLGRAGNAPLIKLYANRLKVELLRDPRVASVQSVDAVFSDTIVTFKISFIPSGTTDAKARLLEVSIPLGALRHGCYRLYTNRLPHHRQRTGARLAIRHRESHRSQRRIGNAGLPRCAGGQHRGYGSKAD